MKVLFAASEAIPFIKSGGLGDVVGTLPKSLKKLGVDVRVIIPKYVDIPYEYKQLLKHKTHFNVSVGWRNQYCGIDECIMDGITFYLVDNEYYFKRPGMYGYYDEAERFAYFSRSVLECLGHIDFKPDVIHCHDWQTALIPVLLEEQYRLSQIHQDIRTVFTIHNLKYQGIYGQEVLEDLFGLDKEYAMNDNFEFYGDINLLKAALYYADMVTTVSPTYAKEIQDEYYGERLDGILRDINFKLRGILNGIDYDMFSPEKDQHIFVNYTHAISGKMENKVKLQAISGLPQNDKIPVLAIVSRLVEQKGFDLVLHVMQEILNMEIQLIVLGVGDNKYEQFFNELEQYFPKKVKSFIEFDISLAQKIYAGADMFLMPSLFEPCGLSQLISLKYGTIPVVRGTGGLKDTVEPYNKITGEGTGFVFNNYNAHEFLYTLEDAVELYVNDEKTWQSLMKRAMNVDFSWKQSAGEYVEVYESLTAALRH